MTEKERLEYQEQGFLKDQIREIEEGLDAGIDVSVYADKDLLAIQMRQIKKGLIDHLNIAPYARKEYDWFQLEEIREGLASFIEVGKYDSPTIPYAKMRQIRKGLEQGIDLSKYLSMDAGVIRQIRKANVSNVDISPYVKEGYDQEQLEEIRIALEQELDIPQYLKLGFRGVSICEIRLGLLNGLDVAVYAKEEYGWQQMREIRLGLEAQIDVSQYSNPYYEWKQMQELRLGLENGLEIEDYNSLMYTASEMQIRRQRLQQSGRSDFDTYSTEETVPREEGGRDGLVVTVTPDEMEAYIRVYEYVNDLARKDILRVLKNEGVVQGVDQREVDKILDGKRNGETVLIAHGKEAIAGKDGYYEYFFRTELDCAPTVLEDGSVDYQNVEWFEQVKRGQKLAYYHAAEKGMQGFTVKGKPLTAKRGKEMPHLHGKGFYIMPDKKTYISDMDGRIELSDSQMEVSKLLMISGVSLATGNIRFDGSIYVKGNVQGGTVIQAGADVMVDGFVESAEIEAEGNIVLRKGMNAAGNGSLKAGGDIEGKFFEAVSLNAGGDIKANYCMNSYLSSGGVITICGKNGAIVGGETYATRGIRVNNVGNKTGIATKLRLGISDKMRKDKNRIDTKIRDDKMELTILQNAFRDFQNKYPAEVRNTLDMYMKIDNAIYTKNKMLDELAEQKEKLEKEMAETASATIVVSGDLNDNVLIDIDGKKWKSKYVYNVTVRLSDNKVSLFANESRI